MAWEIEFTDEFEGWWNSLMKNEQDAVASYVQLLERSGPALGYPYSSNVNQSKHGNMRELRPQYKGEPYRVLYAFDPRRTAILLVGGNKTGDDRWYETFVPLADKLYDEYIIELKQEGVL